MHRTIIITAVAMAACCMSAGSRAADLPLDRLNLPTGFSVSIYAEVEDARQMALGDDGSLYVGTRRTGEVHVLRPASRPGEPPRHATLDSGLIMPSGVAFRNGDLFVAATDRIYIYEDVEGTDTPMRRLLTDRLPDRKHHGWKFIAFGPDGLLYVPVGAPCNICEPESPLFASILRFNPDEPAPEFQVHARGVRNSVGFDWHPRSRELYFTDNGRDMLGDESPPCELNRVSRSGEHFGFPYFHGPGIPDPELAGTRNAADYTEPVRSLGPHVAPLGMTFYTGRQFPEKYHDQIIIPEHGSWNRSEEAGHTGYRLMLVTLRDDGVPNYEVFVDGWLTGNRAWGRPVAALVAPDGSLFVSDDHAGVIYRFRYEG